MTYVDISGRRFGRLVAVELSYTLGQNGGQYWRCICDCGNEKVVKKSNLMKGLTKSCGCLRSEHAREMVKHFERHGIKNTNKRLYAIWQSMKARCLNPSRKEAKYYYLKGVKVCEEWVNNFLAFRDWAIENGYNENLTLDRIDCNGDYTPENCRWVTWYTQNNNTKKNRFITLDGETLTIAQWTRKMNLPRGIISSRLKYGWTEEQAIKTPVNGRKLKLTKGVTL